MNATVPVATDVDALPVPVYAGVEVRALSDRLSLEAQLADAHRAIAVAREILCRFNYTDPNTSVADLHDALACTPGLGMFTP